MSLVFDIIVLIVCILAVIFFWWCFKEDRYTVEVPKSKEELEQEHQWKLKWYEDHKRQANTLPDWMQDKEQKENNTPNWL